MTMNSGIQAGIAFEAVRLCHQDVGKLIADLDGYMTKEKWKRLGNQDAVTSGVSRAAYAQYWMAKRLYRLYFNEDSAPGIVDGINIRFFDDDGNLEQPRLFIGRAKYTVPQKMTVADAADTWDFEDGYGKWYNAQPEDLGQILTCKNEDKKVVKMCIVAVNLYSITKLDDLTSKLVEVQQQFDVDDE